MQLPEKSEPKVFIEIIEYVSNAISGRSTIPVEGKIIISSFTEGEELSEKTSESDNYIQILEGIAELVMGGKKIKLHKGEGILIPAQTLFYFKARGQFKMISTIISGL